MLKAVCFFLGLILLLLGLWIYSTSLNLLQDDPTNSQKRLWAFVAIIVGFFLLVLCAAAGDSVGTWGY